MHSSLKIPELDADTLTLLPPNKPPEVVVAVVLPPNKLPEVIVAVELPPNKLPGDAEVIAVVLAEVVAVVLPPNKPPEEAVATVGLLPPNILPLSVLAVAVVVKLPEEAEVAATAVTFPPNKLPLSALDEVVAVAEVFIVRLSSPKRLAFALGVEVGEVKIAVLSIS